MRSGVSAAFGNRRHSSQIGRWIFHLKPHHVSPPPSILNWRRAKRQTCAGIGPADDLRHLSIHEGRSGIASLTCHVLRFATPPDRPAITPVAQPSRQNPKHDRAHGPMPAECEHLLHHGIRTAVHSPTCFNQHAGACGNSRPPFDLLIACALQRNEAHQIPAILCCMKVDRFAAHQTIPVICHHPQLNGTQRGSKVNRWVMIMPRLSPAQATISMIPRCIRNITSQTHGRDLPPQRKRRETKVWSSRVVPSWSSQRLGRAGFIRWPGT
jgi:hypothetical protein